MSKRLAEEDNNTCTFFLAKKKRTCRMKTLEGMMFCPHHSHLEIDQVSNKGCRIPCPFDSSHFCYEAKLHKHLKICNARKKEKPDYYVENINVGDLVHNNAPKLNLNDVSDEELMDVIQRIKQLHDEVSVVIKECTSQHPLLLSEMEKSDDGFNSFKHMRQQAALLSVMENAGFLKNGSCFVEFGAGKGQLMYWIVKCCPEVSKPVFVLVDRSAQRHKCDNKFKGSDVQIQRIRIDIQNLFLGKLNSIQGKLDKMIAVSKHLCGAATDMALKCLVDTLVQEENGKTTTHMAFGLLMALCCHHRCTWNSYVGKDFMHKHNITNRDFQIMCCIASWATCGPRKLDKKETQEQVDNQQENRYKKLNLEHEERENIGLKCKRIIDVGRAFYLKNKGYQVDFIKYIDKSVSLENIALLGVCTD